MFWASSCSNHPNLWVERSTWMMMSFSSLWFLTLHRLTHHPSQGQSPGKVNLQFKGLASKLIWVTLKPISNKTWKTTILSRKITFQRGKSLIWRVSRLGHRMMDRTYPSKCSLIEANSAKSKCKRTWGLCFRKQKLQMQSPHQVKHHLVTQIKSTSIYRQNLSKKKKRKLPQREPRLWGSRKWAQYLPGNRSKKS